MRKFNKKSTVAMLCMVLMLTVLSCGKEEPVSNPVDFSELPCYLKWNNSHYNISDSLLIINSNEKFNALFDCNEIPQLNFSNQTVLCAFGNVPGAIGDKTVNLVSKGNSYTMNVTITINSMWSINGEAWSLAIVTDKLNSNVTLNVVVTDLINL